MISKRGNLEEAVLTYDLGNGFSISAGKMLTYMGFEAYDPTNMYQYSYAYDMGNTSNTGAQMQFTTLTMLVFPLIMVQMITVLVFGQVLKTVRV